MNVICYFDEELCLCPVKKYFNQYLVQSRDSKEQAEFKEKILVDIDRKINHVRQNNGQPTPPISKPLKGYGFFEIRKRKDDIILIRVLYCRYNSSLVLLNAFEKPDDCNSKKDKREVKRYLDVTDQYYRKFLANPKKYEKYED
jgi:phage-related protein